MANEKPTSAERRRFGTALLAYLNSSPTMFHATENAACLLKQPGGFTELKENSRWTLARGGKYFTRRDNSAFIAFTVGAGALSDTGFRVIAAHTDSPCFKIKPGGCMVTPDGYIKLNTEVYGGVILNTWFDRPLSIAGRVMVKHGNTVREQLVDLQKPLLVIPSLCIHFKKDVNENNSLNKQLDVLPLFGLAADQTLPPDKGDPLLRLLAAHLETTPENIPDYDLYLYICEPGTFVGESAGLLSAAKLDDLSMLYAGMHALVTVAENDHPSFCVLAAFDGEEVGSKTPAGADAAYLMQILKRMANALGQDEEGFYMALARSAAISADAAHAVHPNYADKHDPKNRPVLGGGPVIKYSAAKRYATGAPSATFFIRACEKAGVPYQRFANRSDMPGGSTVGPVMASLTAIQTVDVGTPLLAMHAARELGSVDDVLYTADAFRAFYAMTDEG